MLLTACAGERIRHVEITPQVELPERPSADIDWRELCAKIHSDEACENPADHDIGAFHYLQDEIDGIISWGLELEAIIEEIADTE